MNDILILTAYYPSSGKYHIVDEAEFLSIMARTTDSFEPMIDRRKGKVGADVIGYVSFNQLLPQLVKVDKCDSVSEWLRITTDSITVFDFDIHEYDYINGPLYRFTPISALNPELIAKMEIRDFKESLPSATETPKRKLWLI